MTTQSAIHKTLVDAGIIEESADCKLASYADYLEAENRLTTTLERAVAAIADAKRLTAQMNAYLLASAELDKHEREERERQRASTRK